MIKLTLNTWDASCEDCGYYEGYELYLNGKEIASYEGHFGNGEGPPLSYPEEALSLVSRILDKIGIVHVVEYTESES